MNSLYAVARGGKNKKSTESALFGEFIIQTLKKSGKETQDIYLHHNGVITLDGLPVILSEIIHKFNLVWIAFLGNTEDSIYITSICENFSIPFVGHSSMISNIIHDKSNLKKIAKQHGLKSPYFSESFLQDSDSSKNEALKIFGIIGTPVYLKNNKASFKDEYFLANNFFEIETHLKELQKNHKHIMVEKHLQGEIVSVFLHKENNSIYANIFLEESKSNKIKKTDIEKIKEQSLFLYHALCLNFHIEFDFLVHKTGIYFLDAHTYPEINSQKYIKTFKMQGKSLENYILETVANF